MKITSIIIQIIVLYGIYSVGEFIHTTFKLAIPGSIIGMLILFLLLLCNIIKDQWLEDGAGLLLNHLTLLFIPATVGIIEYLTFFKGKGFITVLITSVSTVLVMISSGMIGQWIAMKKEKRVISLNNEYVERVRQ